MRITHGLKYPAAVVASVGLLAGGYGVTAAIGAGDGEGQLSPVTIPTPHEGWPVVAIETAPGISIGGEAGPAAGQNVSIGVRPMSASIVSLDLDDGDSEFVEFRFADRIQEILDAHAFLVHPYAGDSAVQATAARLVQGAAGGRSVLAEFPAGTDLSTYTLAVVENGAVANRDGHVNIQASVPLEGSRQTAGPGWTAGPDLVSTAADQTLNRIIYRFDERLEEMAKPDPAAFGFYTRDGAAHEGASIVTVEDQLVTIQFDEAAGDEVEHAVSPFARAGAVSDLKASESPLGSIAGRTSLPTLVSTTPVSGMPTQLDFRFSGPVEHGEAGAFAVYSDAGTPYRAEAISRPAAAVVRVTFPAVRDFADRLVLGAVDSGAVRALDRAAAGNAVGTAPVRSSHVAWGASSGPGLVGVRLDRLTGEATFTFDGKLDDDAAVDPSAFSLITVSNRLEPGSAVVLVRGNRAIVQFPEHALAGAEGVTVDEGAVADEQGQANPVGTAPITDDVAGADGAGSGAEV